MWGCVYVVRAVFLAVCPMASATLSSLLLCPFVHYRSWLWAVSRPYVLLLWSQGIFLSLDCLKQTVWVCFRAGEALGARCSPCLCLVESACCPAQPGFPSDRVGMSNGLWDERPGRREPCRILVRITPWQPKEPAILWSASSLALPLSEGRGCSALCCVATSLALGVVLGAIK